MSDLKTQSPKLVLDFHENQYKTVLAKQYDKGSRFVPIQCTDNGIPYAVDSSYTVHVEVLTSDDRAIMDNVQIQDDGTLLLELTESMLYCHGTSVATIRIYDTKNKLVLSPMNFYIITEENPYDEDRVIDSDEFSALSEALFNIEEASNIAKEATETINNVVSSIEGLEENIKNAESLRVSAEESRQNSESLRQSNEAKRQNDMESIKSDYEEIVEAETIRETNEEIRKSAELKRQTDTATVITNAEETIARLDDAIEMCENASNEHALSAAQSAQNASISESNANTSASSALDSATTASQKATEATNSANSAKTSAETAIQKALDASTNANTATQKADSASASATLAESYAVGGTNTRENEDIDNARYYKEQAELISQGLSGALLPMGTIPFSKLSEQTKSSGYMYNISDDFTTDDTFKDGAGYTYSAGTNVYYTADGYWDCIAGTQVVGVKGSAESSYRKGNINITPENLGLGNVLPLLGDTDISSIGDGTVTGGLSALDNATKTAQYGNCNNTDLNTIMSAGIYICGSNGKASLENNFPQTTKGYLIVYTKTGGQVTQIYYANKSYTFTRNYWDNAWSAWKKQATIDDLANYLSLSGGNVTGGVTFPGAAYTTKGFGDGVVSFGTSSGGYVNVGYDGLQAKKGTATSDLYLQYAGGYVKVGNTDGGVYVGKYANIRSDGEGGAVCVTSKAKGNVWEMDAYNGNLRFYTYASDGNLKAVEIERETGTILASISGSSASCTGNSATATKATQDSAGQQINTTYIKGLSVSGKTITYTKGDGTTGTITTRDTNTTYSAGTGISLSGTTFSNSGVRSVATGTSNGTISVNTGGTTANVAVKGLGSAAYTASTAYAAASHTHSYLPLSGGTLSGNLNMDSKSISGVGTLTVSGNVCGLYFMGVSNQDARVRAGDSSKKVYLMGTDINCTNYAVTANVPIYASAFTSPSSKLIKENIQPLTEEEANKILSLDVVSFDYKEKFGGNKEQRGLIAEDVLNIIPSCVNVPDNYDENDFDEEKGIGNKVLSIDYSKLVPYLIKTVQMQEERIAALEAKLQ